MSSMIGVFCIVAVLLALLKFLTSWIRQRHLSGKEGEARMAKRLA